MNVISGKKVKKISKVTSDIERKKDTIMSNEENALKLLMKWNKF